MKLTRTLVVVGLLAVGGTAANASTFSWGSSWSAYSSSSYGSQHRERLRGIASALSHRYNTDSDFRDNVNRVAYALNRIRDRVVVHNQQDNGGQTSEVPLPAGGLLLVGALGMLALKRRQKT